MLPVIFWKIGCELAYVKRALWPQFDRKVYYFAFGANLCRDVLELRRISVFENGRSALASLAFAVADKNLASRYDTGFIHGCQAGSQLAK